MFGAALKSLRSRHECTFLFFFFTFNALFREAVSRGVMKKAYGGHVSEDVGTEEGSYKRYNHMAKVRRKVN